MKDQIQLFKIVFDFLDSLSKEELKMLSTQKATLTLLKAEKTATKKVKVMKVSSEDIEEICKKINEFSTRGDASDYINSLSLKREELKGIAEKFDISIGTRTTKNQIVDKIVENVIGAKLKFDALLNVEYK